MLKKMFTKDVSTRVQSKIVETFNITLVGTFTAPELVTQGKYDWSTEYITVERFPLADHQTVSRTIALVSFDNVPTSEKVLLAEFAASGLERPTYEDALYFGIQHPEVSRNRPVAFPHKSVQKPGGPGVLVLSESVGERGIGERGIGLRWFDPKDAITNKGWGSGCIFAGVRK